jgi:preprotein translocase subunit SecA
VTSSAELAVPQSAEYKPFYEMFKFTSSHNKKEPLEKKDAYKVDILYGAVEDYQADVLRDEYSKLGTRSNRPFDVVIVDEVDSMFIDGKTCDGSFVFADAWNERTGTDSRRHLASN